MNTGANYTMQNGGAQPSPETLALVRQNIRSLLMQSPAFASLPQEKQRALANQMVQIGAYLAAPEGIPGNRLPSAGEPSRGAAAKDPYAFAQAEGDVPNASDVREIGKSKFKAEAAREGAAVAGALLKAVSFPAFVSGLIKGVFHSIVEASIDQMEAYGRLVADVAKTINQFRDENVSANQGRDHLVDQFPDMFAIGLEPDASGNQSPRIRLRDDVDESAALKKVNSTLPMEGGPLKSLDLDDEETENKLVQAARTQLATSRQQLLATMVLMGINRIVVTDGRISAKILYDFQARDTRRFQRSAVAYDYAKDAYGNLQTTSSGEGEYDYSSEGGERTYTRGESGGYEQRDPSYYAKGKYKYTEQPVMTAMSAASEASDAALQTRASLAGAVEVNFKSDYFPLEKMADSFQIAQIQNAAKPGQATPAAGAGATQNQAPATSQQPATQPASPAPKA